MLSNCWRHLCARGNEVVVRPIPNVSAWLNHWKPVKKTLIAPPGPRQLLNWEIVEQS